jgi:peptidoglycan/LPS O-acetylase OafA/YrhL
MSLGKRMDIHGGHGPGFDVLRLVLAISIVLSHAFIIVPNQPDMEYQPGLWMLHFGLLAMFFALSGYLVSGSALRLSLNNFLLNRGLRIFPALVVEITLSAMILGPVFTTLPLGQYFTSFGTYHYLTNMLAWINYELPGVFIHNPNIFVNGSLWTIPAEFLCYLIISLFMIYGLLKKPLSTVTFGTVIAIVGVVLIRLGFSKHNPGFLGLVFSHFDIGPTIRLIIAFIAGIIIYQLRYRIIYSGKLAILCIVYLAAIAAIPPQTLSLPTIGFITAAPFAYLTVFIGASDIPTPKLFKRGDYSYGIYLYGYPLQQAVYTLTSSVTSPWLQFLLVLPPLVFFAAISWHLIERPILAQRRRFSFVASVRGVTDDRTTNSPHDAAPFPPEARVKAEISS